jgi:hypothetical protein
VQVELTYFSSRKSGSFLKKRTKKLLALWAMAVAAPTPQPWHKSLFASFSSEKEGLT